MKIFPQRITELLNYLINDEGVCRTSPATPSLLNISALTWMWSAYKLQINGWVKPSVDGNLSVLVYLAFENKTICLIFFVRTVL